MAASDEELMERLVGGQQSALDQLLQRYKRSLYAFALRLVQRPSVADDVFQETFLRVYRKRKSFQKGARFRPWLFQICLNLCRDYHRKAKRRQEVELSEELVGHDPRPGPEERAQKAAEARRVQDAISRLPEKHRAVLILTQYEGLSQQEAAAALGIPEGTVKSRKFKAIRALAKLLAPVVGHHEKKSPKK
jgi:RNA polymerase sigma-70 factor (ECF subfamily)